MPTYEYFCPANHQTVEVMHGMSRSVSTWAELCELADQPTGQTPGDTPGEKLLGAGMVLRNSRATPKFDCGMPPEMGGCCCGGCGMG